MRNNTSLSAAKKERFDEFYTPYEEIERELYHYLTVDPNLFRGKVVACPCDDPRKSQFTRYFLDHFIEYGIERLICTCIAPEGETKGKIIDVDRTCMLFGMKVSDPWAEDLEGNGDFRSPEVRALIGIADIVVTNPPLSLFSDFYDVIRDKQFIVISSQTAPTLANVFPDFKYDNIWRGTRWHNRIGGRCIMFELPEGVSARGLESEIIDGKLYASVPNAGWLTNVPHDSMPQPMKLNTMLDNIRNSKFTALHDHGYDLVVNYSDPILNVPYVQAIPSNYAGLMAVPISFIEYYCPDQFEIVSISSDRHWLYPEADKVRITKDEDSRYRDLNGTCCAWDHGKFKPLFTRFIIRRRREYVLDDIQSQLDL